MLLRADWGFARSGSISGNPQGSGNQCACAAVPHPADTQFLELVRTMKPFNTCYLTLRQGSWAKYSSNGQNANMKI